MTVVAGNIARRAQSHKHRSDTEAISGESSATLSVP
jgi:hypothetical protein